MMKGKDWRRICDIAFLTTLLYSFVCARLRGNRVGRGKICGEATGLLLNFHSYLALSLLYRRIARSTENIYPFTAPTSSPITNGVPDGTVNALKGI
jgi:hypothetical protein